jgi:hypothetical protein
MTDKRIESIKRALGLTDETREQNARRNLDGALIEIEHNQGRADAECLRAISRVVGQLATVEWILFRKSTSSFSGRVPSSPMMAMSPVTNAGQTISELRTALTPNNSDPSHGCRLRRPMQNVAEVYFHWKSSPLVRQPVQPEALAKLRLAGPNSDTRAVIVSPLAYRSAIMRRCRGLSLAGQPKVTHTAAARRTTLASPQNAAFGLRRPPMKNI